MVEYLSAERAGEALSEGIMSGARIAVRTTRIPDDLNTPANRAPRFVSWSQTTTCGAPFMVAFLARTPSLSNSPRMRSAPQRGLRPCAYPIGGFQLGTLIGSSSRLCAHGGADHTLSSESIPSS